MQKSLTLYRRIARIITTAAATAICAAWAQNVAAQAKCTMPNGVTITKNFGNCPLDAVAAFTLDGRPLPKPSDTAEGKAAQERAAAEQKELQDRVTDAAMREQQAVLDQWKKEAAEKKRLESIEEEKRRQANVDAIIYRGCATLGLPSPQQCDTKVGILSTSSLTVKVHFLNFDPYDTCKTTAWTLRKKLLNERHLSNWQVRVEYTPTGKALAECPL